MRSCSILSRGATATLSTPAHSYTQNRSVCSPPGSAAVCQSPNRAEVNREDEREVDVMESDTGRRSKTAFQPEM